MEHSPSDIIQRAIDLMGQSVKVTTHYPSQGVHTISGKISGVGSMGDEATITVVLDSMPVHVAHRLIDVNHIIDIATI